MDELDQEANDYSYEEGILGLFLCRYPWSNERRDILLQKKSVILADQDDLAR